MLLLLAAPFVSPEVLEGLRADLPAVIAGIFLCGLALVAGALTLAFRRGGDRTPLWFSLFTGIYGLRLVLDSFPAELLLGLSALQQQLAISTLTYLIPIPFTLFVEELVGASSSSPTASRRPALRMASPSATPGSRSTWNAMPASAPRPWRTLSWRGFPPGPAAMAAVTVVTAAGVSKTTSH